MLAVRLIFGGNKIQALLNRQDNLRIVDFSGRRISAAGGSG